MRHRTIAAGLCTLLIIPAVQAGPGSFYFITQIQATDLGTLGGDESVAYDINDLGEIVGWALDSTGVQRAFIYRDSGMEQLSPDSDVRAVAYGINNSTRVVGHYSLGSSDVTHAFHWKEGSEYFPLNEAVSVDVAPYCVTGSSARAINDFGVIVGIRKVGCFVPEPTVDRAVRWWNYAGPWHDLLDVQSTQDYYAYDIDDSGLIVGEAGETIYTLTGACVWDESVVSDVPHPLAYGPEWFVPGSQRARGINDYSRIVGDVALKPQGYRTDDVVTRAFYWSGSSLNSIELEIFDDSTNSSAYEINDQNFMVGYADRGGVFNKSAVVWHGASGITELLPPLSRAGSGLSLCTAYAVNDRTSSGLVQAVGYCHVNGQRRAIRWDIQTVAVASPPPPSVSSRAR